MMVLSAKFTILISWSPIYITLIVLLVSMKLASTSAKIIYYSIGHPWRTPRISVKESDKMSFILTLNWMLVYATLII